MRYLIGIIFSFMCYGQTSPNQTIAQYFYDSSSNQRYICIAPYTLPSNLGTPNNSTANPSSISIASGTLTNIVVSGGIATVTVPSTSIWNAGTYADLSIVVSGSATNVLNGGYLVTSSNTTTTTFTFTTSAANATYTDAKLAISTANPVLTQLAWNLLIFTYDSNNRVTGSFPVNNGYTAPCSARSSY